MIGVGSHVKAGGKGRQDAGVFRGIAGVRLVGLCDPDHANLDPEVERFRFWTDAAWPPGKTRCAST